MTPDEFSRLFRSFQRTAFRLETLPQYLVPGEADAFRAFKQGRPLPPRTVENNDWLRLIADTTAAGKRWQQVHVVDRPLSDYLRFEFAGYAENVVAGQEIYIADRDAHPDLAGLVEDFWLFDDELLVRMHYDDEGHFLRAERALDADLDDYRRQRDLALAHALPLDEYVAKHGDRLTE